MFAAWNLKKVWITKIPPSIYIYWKFFFSLFFLNSVYKEILYYVLYMGRNAFRIFQLSISLEQSDGTTWVFACWYRLWKLKNHHSISPPFLLEGKPSVPNFEKLGIRKTISAWEVLTSLCHRYLPGRLTMFLVKKDFVKWNMALRAQFSCVNLDLF